MKILIGYTTKEGHTRKIARHISDLIVDEGHSVELLNLEDADDITLERFDNIVLAAPVHAGHYPRALGEFVSKNLDKLETARAKLISVSLAAAGHDADDWRGLNQIVSDFGKATGWTPSSVEHVAGAYMPTRYDILTGFIMARIVSAKDPEADTSKDKVYTDWPALNAWVNRWLEQ